MLHKGYRANDVAGRHGVSLPRHCSLAFLLRRSALQYSRGESLCSLLLCSSGQEPYSIAYVFINQRLRNVADIFCIAYELVDNWYRSIIGFVRYTLLYNACFKWQCDVTQCVMVLCIQPALYPSYTVVISDVH